MWLSHPQFHNEISNWWSSTQVDGWKGFRFMKKFQVIEVNIKTWNKEVFGKVEESKAKISLDLELLDRIEESRNLENNEREERSKMKKDFETIVKNEDDAGPAYEKAIPTGNEPTNRLEQTPLSNTN